jgi:hypothetical protein
MNKNAVRFSFPVITMLLLASCNLASQTPVTLAATLTPLLAATSTLSLSTTDTPTLTSPPTDTPMPAPSPTDTLTPTPSQPVFDPAALGDNRELASFILTRKDKTTGGGEVIETKDTLGYIKEPFSAYSLGTTPYGNRDPKYMIDGRFYEKNSNENFWNISMEPDPTDVDFWLQSPADMREGYPMYLVNSAQFVGQEDFQGIPANHFTFDQTDLSEQSDPTGTYKIEKAQGDLYLSQDGNYLLQFHLKQTGNVYSPAGSSGYVHGVREFTEELSSINQLTEITLPPDYLALKLELDPGLPVPAGAALHALNHSNDGRKYTLYDYFMPATVSKSDFLEFYQNLLQTNGWTVSQVGGKTKYDYCQTLDCVVLKKGNAQAVLAVPDQCVSNMPANDICFFALYYK